MLKPVKILRNPVETRRKLVHAASRLMLHQGYAATTVDQICTEAGLTKGSFFHYFASKDAIARAAIDSFAQMGTYLYTPASGCGVDPLEQIHHLLDIMISFNQRPGEPCLCMVGMMSQELSFVNPDMRAACAGHLADWTRRVTAMLTEAKEIHTPRTDFDPEGVAWFLNSLWQGSMLIGKTRTQDGPDMVIRNIGLARDFIDSLFVSPSARRSSKRMADRSIKKIGKKRGMVS